MNTHLLSLSLSVVFFLSLPFSSLSARCNPHDKKVLLQIKKSLNNPYLLASWNPATADCCDWYCLECNSTTHRVTALTMFADDKLSGHIPAAVGDLPYLQTLMFHKLPNLVGEIPPTITKLSNLRGIRISWTNLSGPVPSFLGQIKNLDSLDLSFNNFTGSIPPSLSQLTKLVSIGLSRNKLTGGIPDSFGNFTRSLQSIDLSHNQLTGSIPKSLGNLNLTSFDVSRNNLSGDFSFMFGSNKTIETADFSRNTFQFDLTNVAVFPANLTTLDLNHNKIYGSLPRGLTALTLNNFNVSYNRLCGQIPTGGKLQSFDQTAYFHNRCLCGSPLPACK